MSRISLPSALAVPFAAICLLLVSANALSYTDYSGCESCHGIFNSGSYTSLHDESDWGTSLMGAHWTFCNSGTVEYDIPTVDRQGTVPIERVAGDNIELCEAINAD